MQKIYYVEIGYTNLKFVNSLNIKDYYFYPCYDLKKFLHKWLEQEGCSVYLLNNNLDLVNVINEYINHPNLTIINQTQLINAINKNHLVSYNQMGNDLLMINYYVQKKLKHYQQLCLYSFGSAIVGMYFNKGLLINIFISPNLSDINALAINKFHLSGLDPNKILRKNQQLNNLSAIYEMNRLMIMGYLNVFNNDQAPVIFTGNGAIEIIDHFHIAYDYTYLKNLVLNALVEFVNNEILQFNQYKQKM